MTRPCEIPVTTERRKQIRNYTRNTFVGVSLLVVWLLPWLLFKQPTTVSNLEGGYLTIGELWLAVFAIMCWIRVMVWGTRIGVQNYGKPYVLITYLTAAIILAFTVTTCWIKLPAPLLFAEFWGVAVGESLSLITFITTIVMCLAVLVLAALITYSIYNATIKDNKLVKAIQRYLCDGWFSPVIEDEE